jgi:hypothetical protein
MMSRAMIASALMFGTAAGAADAAPAPAGALATQREAPAAVAPVYYRCVIPVCGPYRCVWVNRCRRPWWW